MFHDKMQFAAATVLCALLLLLQPTSALFTTDRDSPCYNACNGTDTGTEVTDLVCLDDDFAETARGRLLQTCLECQSTSFYWSNATDSDQYYYLRTHTPPNAPRKPSS